MRRLIIAAALVLTANAVSAQGKPLPRFYSPLAKFEKIGGYDAAKGEYGSSYSFGRYSEGRFQLGDGSLASAFPFYVRISYRPSPGLNYTSSYGGGRRWKMVTIDMSKTSIVRMAGPTGSTWTANHGSTPARVFSAAVDWPSRKGVIGKKAITNWSDHSFHFTGPWIRTRILPRNPDILADYQFSGGTLANNQVWTSSAARYYYLDGYSIQSFAAGVPKFYHDNSNPGCTDSRARPPFVPAHNILNVWHGAPRAPNPWNIMMFSHTAFGLAPSKPYVCHIGVSVNPTGLAYGSGCERLFITGPTLGFPGIADNQGRSPVEVFGRPGFARAIPSLVGATLCTQDVFSDSVTGAAHISAACAVTVPPLNGIPSAAAAKRYCREFHNGSGSAVFGIIHGYANPICKYN